MRKVAPHIEIRYSWTLSVLAALALSSVAHASGSSPAPPKQTPPPEAAPSSFGKTRTRPSLQAAPTPRRSTPRRGRFPRTRRRTSRRQGGLREEAVRKGAQEIPGGRGHGPTYYEAWNMVGYCSRKSGDLKRSFQAYEKCLLIEPEYAQAHEYLGEAYLMSGDVAKAKEQLLWLVSRKSDQAGSWPRKSRPSRKAGPAPPRTAETPRGTSEAGEPRTRASRLRARASRAVEKVTGTASPRFRLEPPPSLARHAPRALARG